jgi:D-inositol-3-phosphate glycosyltransferase
MLVGAVAMLSMHTSPLAQPGEGDSGGMNVFVRELGTALAQAGVATRIYTRRTDAAEPDRVLVEPGLEVLHVDAGAPDLPKECLAGVVDEFADAVSVDLRQRGDVSVIHANYWLSGVAGHRLKHELSIPLVSTFHTLARVKSSSGDPEPEGRVVAERDVIGCSDTITASSPTEADDLVLHYGADRGRIELVAPGVHHAFFSPGDRAGARRAIDLDDRPVLLFVGRIQPLKGLDVAVRALAALADRRAMLVVVGGPSGADGEAELARIRDLIDALGLHDRVRFVPAQPHHTLSTYYRAADVCLVPSRSESFGLVALEAAACGLPVVAAAVGGLRTLVDDGRTGFLVEGREPRAFAARVDELLARPELAASMGGAAAARSLDYTWSTTAARLRRVYADLAGAHQLVSCGA